MRLNTYLRHASRPILAVVLLSSWTAFFIIPYILSTGWARQSLSVVPSVFFVSLGTGSFVALLLIAFGPTRAFSVRYRRNASLRPPPFTYADAIALFVVGVIVLILLVPRHALGGVVISSTLATWIKCLVVLFVAWACAVFWWPRVVFRCPSHKETDRSHAPDPPGAGYFHDAPITHDAEDSLGRSPFVEDLYQQIVKYPFSESFVFGLHGSWGEGKTSVMRLLRTKLDGNRDMTVVTFDPWYFGSADASVRDFYEGIYSALNRSFFLPSLRRLLAQYQRVLSASLRTFAGIEIGLDLAHGSVETLKQHVQACITRTRQRLVILIDDIDRLRDRDEVLSVFQLVKLSGNFDHTIFVLSFDDKIVTSLVNAHSPGDHDFLDKVIQCPIHLPAIYQEKIDEFLVSGEKRLFEELRMTPEQQEAASVFDMEYPVYISQLFNTLRIAKRFLNGLADRLPAVKDEVHCGDFLVLECIRMFYPSVYHDIWWNRRIYLPDSWDAPLYAPDRQEQLNEVQTHVESIVKDQARPSVLLKLLKLLFVEVHKAFQPAAGADRTPPDTYRQQQRITHPDVFPRYFTLLVPPVELSDQVVRALLTAWSDMRAPDREPRIVQDLSGCSKETLPQLLDRLRVFASTIPTEVQTALAQVLYRNADAFRAAGDKQSPLTPYFKIRNLIFQLIDMSVGDQIQGCLVQLIEETPSLDLAATAVAWSDRNDLPYLNIIQQARKGELQNTLSTRLTKDLIEHGEDIFEKEGDYGAYVLYQWGSYDQQTMNTYVFALVDQHPNYVSKIIEPFISHLGSPLGGGTLEYEKLVALYNEQRLYSLAAQRLRAAGLTKKEGDILKAFVGHHDHRGKAASETTRREANQQRFVEALSAGRDHATKKEFQEALRDFDQALAITDWDDAHGWLGQARYECWRCLLELAWNNGSPLSEPFEQAKTIAANDATINTLAAAFGYPGQRSNPVLEFYSCLFYYLLWHFSNDSEKVSARTSFENHYMLLVRDQSSSTKEHRERLQELHNRINTGR